MGGNPNEIERLKAVQELPVRIAQYKGDVIKHTPLDVARRHILSGDCAVISADDYFLLRSKVANQYGLHPNDVIVVGSGKLGFSVAPQKKYRPFGDSSDLDVVIV